MTPTQGLACARVKPTCAHPMAVHAGRHRAARVVMVFIERTHAPAAQPHERDSLEQHPVDRQHRESLEIAATPRQFALSRELANTHKVPVPINPMSLVPADTKMPVVRHGGESIARIRLHATR